MAAAAAKAAKKASERDAMDDSVEIHAPDDTLHYPSKHSSSDGSSKAKRTKTKATSFWVLGTEVSGLYGGTAQPSRVGPPWRRRVRTIREDTGPTIDRTLPDISRPDGERTSGPAQVTREFPPPGNVPSPALFPRTPVLRALPLNIIVNVVRRDVRLSPKVVKPSKKRTIIVISSPARQVHVESAPEVQVPAPVTDGSADEGPATVQVPAPVADGPAGADPAAGDGSDTGDGWAISNGTTTGNGTATDNGSNTGDGLATGDGSATGYGPTTGDGPDTVDVSS